MIVKRKFNLFSLIGLLSLFIFSLTSCETEEQSIVDIDNFADSSIEQIQQKTVGKKYCLEYVFPISIQFIDGTIAEVTDYENLHETISTFFEENDIEKNKENKPTLIFPVEVLNQEGEIIQVTTQDELRELKSECPREGKCKSGKKGKGFKCFDLVFPISVIIANQTLSFDDKASLKAAIKAYKEDTGDEAERPELVFPLSIIYEDGTITEVVTKEELKALKQACQDN